MSDQMNQAEQTDEKDNSVVSTATKPDKVTDCGRCPFYYECDTNYGECENVEAQKLYADVEDMTAITHCPYFPKPSTANYEDIKHECKSCKAEWVVKMLLVGGDVIKMPTYTGSDTYLCPECGSENTVMHSNRPKIEPSTAEKKEDIWAILKNADCRECVESLHLWNTSRVCIYCKICKILSLIEPKVLSVTDEQLRGDIAKIICEDGGDTWDLAPDNYKEDYRKVATQILTLIQGREQALCDKCSREHWALKHAYMSKNIVSEGGK